MESSHDNSGYNTSLYHSKKIKSILNLQIIFIWNGSPCSCNEQLTNCEMNLSFDYSRRKNEKIANKVETRNDDGLGGIPLVSNASSQSEWS